MVDTLQRRRFPPPISTSMSPPSNPQNGLLWLDGDSQEYFQWDQQRGLWIGIRSHDVVFTRHNTDTTMHLGNLRIDNPARDGIRFEFPAVILSSNLNMTNAETGALHVYRNGADVITHQLNNARTDTRPNLAVLLEPDDLLSARINNTQSGTWQRVVVNTRIARRYTHG